MKNEQLKKLFLFFLLAIFVPSSIAETIEFLDVTVADSEKDSSCIFKVNGKTVVVDWHETVTVDDITIFVKNIYPVNTGTEDKDQCEFLYSAAGSSEKESLLQKTQIGNKVLTFFLGTRAEASATEETDAEEETETGFHETPETARVLIDGYDVTADAVDTLLTETTGIPEEPAEKQEQGFLSTFFSWIFGKE